MPQPIYIVPTVRCDQCHMDMVVTDVRDQLSMGRPKRFKVHHFDRMSGCPNADRVWVIEMLQPKVYPVDLGTGQPGVELPIDEFGGMV